MRGRRGGRETEGLTRLSPDDNIPLQQLLTHPAITQPVPGLTLTTPTPAYLISTFKRPQKYRHYSQKTELCKGFILYNKCSRSSEYFQDKPKIARRSRNQKPIPSAHRNRDETIDVCPTQYTNPEDGRKHIKNKAPGIMLHSHDVEKVVSHGGRKKKRQKRRKQAHEPTPWEVNMDPKIIRNRMGVSVLDSKIDGRRITPRSMRRRPSRANPWSGRSTGGLRRCVAPSGLPTGCGRCRHAARRSHRCFVGRPCESHG